MSKLSQGIKKSVALALATATILPLTQVSFGAVPVRRPLPAADNAANNQQVQQQPQQRHAHVGLTGQITAETVSRMRYGREDRRNLNSPNSNRDRNVVLLTRREALRYHDMLRTPKRVLRNLTSAFEDGRLVLASLTFRTPKGHYDRPDSAIITEIANRGLPGILNLGVYNRGNLFDGVLDTRYQGAVRAFGYTVHTKRVYIICNNQAEAIALRGSQPEQARRMLSNTFCFLKN